MSHKNVAIGTLMVLVSIVTVGLAVQAYLMLQAINPAAAIAAIAVGVIGPLHG